MVCRMGSAAVVGGGGRDLIKPEVWEEGFPASTLPSPFLQSPTRGPECFGGAHDSELAGGIASRNG